MARRLNTNCDFDAGFFISDIPRDAIQVVLKIKINWGKHTVTEVRRGQRNTDLGKVIPNVSPVSLQIELNLFYYIRYMILGLLQTQEHGYKLLEILSLHTESSMTQALIKRMIQ